MRIIKRSVEGYTSVQTNNNCKTKIDFMREKVKKDKKYFKKNENFIKLLLGKKKNV